MRLSKSADPSPPFTAIARYEAACATVARLQAKDDDLLQEELARLSRGEKIEADIIAAIVASEAEVDALLRGDASKPTVKRRTIRDIVHERTAVRLALPKAQDDVERAKRELAAEKFALTHKEQRDVGRKMVMALFELDRALRERDLLVQRIGLPRGTLPHESWPLAGRLSNTASEIYRLAELGVTNGWISQRELDTEFSDARKADTWR